MTDKSSKSGESFVKKHYRALLPLAAALLLAGAALWIAFLPDPGKDAPNETTSESRRILQLAKDLLRQNNAAEAVELLKSYITVHRQDQEVRLRLAELYLRLGDLERCDTTLTEALAISPEYAEAIWMQGLVALARGNNPAERFARAARTPNAPPDVLGNYGLYLLSIRQPDKARTYLQRAADGETGNGRVYAELGKFAFEKNQADEACRLWKRATELSPRDAEAWALLAEVQKNRNEPAAALASLHRALEVADGPQRAAVLMELGRTHVTQKNWSQAAEMFARATDSPSVRTQAALWAAKCFYFHQAYAKAMFYIDIACAALPDDPTLNEWKRKIENARFGPPPNPEQPAPSLLSIPPEAKTQNQTTEEK